MRRHGLLGLRSPKRLDQSIARWPKEVDLRVGGLQHVAVRKCRAPTGGVASTHNVVWLSAPSAIMKSSAQYLPFRLGQRLQRLQPAPELRHSPTSPTESRWSSTWRRRKLVLWGPTRVAELTEHRNWPLASLQPTRRVARSCQCPYTTHLCLQIDTEARDKPSNTTTTGSVYRFASRSSSAGPRTPFLKTLWPIVSVRFSGCPFCCFLGWCRSCHRPLILHQYISKETRVGAACARESHLSIRKGPILIQSS